MSKQLIESILSGNMLEANDMVEAKMAEIREKKMYEMKRMYASSMSEALGGLSMKEIEARKKAGYVKASAPKEKGGLGLSSYDLGQEEKKKRLAGRLKKKVAEETIDEMRAPGEVPGSAERKQDAEKLRSVRKGLNVVGVSKSDRGKFTKDYLAARKAQIKPEPQLSAGAGEDKPETQAPEVKIGSDEVKTSRRQRLAQQGLKMLKARSGGAKTSDRYGAALDRATELERRGRKGAVARIKKAYRVHRIKQGIKAVGTGIKNAGKRFMDSPIMSDLHSIGTRNL